MPNNSCQNMAVDGMTTMSCLAISSAIWRELVRAFTILMSGWVRSMASMIWPSRELFPAVVTVSLYGTSIENS